MNESPRSSKRRKLNTPARNAPSPLPTKTLSTRKSARTTARSVIKTDGLTSVHEDEEVFPKGRSSASKYIVNEPGNRRNEEIKIDVWDDIEGALGENSLKRSTPKPSEPFRKRLSRKTQRQQVESTDTDELLNTTNTPRKYAKRNTNPGKSASRASLRSLANSFRHADPMEVVDQDELAMEIATPPRRTARRTASSISDGRIEPVPALSQSSAKKSTGKQRRQTRLVVQDKAIEATPSRSRKGRPSRFTDGSTVPEIDDEPEQIIASPSKSAISRRTTNSAERLEKEKVQAENIGAEARRDDASSVDGNSVMESVLDPTEPSPFNKPTSARKEKTGISLLVTHLEHGRELDLLKSCIMERISGKRSAPLVGLDSEYKSIHQLVEHTVTAGEGNSLLVIGARGSGKTALVNKVLSEISKDNGQDFHVVRLNGFIHTDDKIALREIWHQLGKEMDLEEENGGVGKNYADTLTTLLALLSHPSEQTGELTDHVARAVIFVMDEFDLFAQHPRQTLLYNLFDIAQARKAPIAVLGLTTRIGVVNSLEKRVKSRFSHRYVHLSLPKTFTAFQETCKANLLVQPELLSVEERGILESAAKLTAGRKGSQVANADIISQWNSNIDTLFASKSFLTTHLAPLFYRSKAVPTALNTFLLPTATLSTILSLDTSSLTAPPDSKLSLIPHLSTLALSLLIAAARLDIIHDSDTCNFNMVYDEYVTLASKARIQSAAGGTSASGSMAKVWGKELARREWETLVQLKLIMPVIGAQTGDFSMVKADVALEEIGIVVGEQKSIEKGLEKWCRQL